MPPHYLPTMSSSIQIGVTSSMGRQIILEGVGLPRFAPADTHMSARRVSEEIAPHFVLKGRAIIALAEHLQSSLRDETVIDIPSSPAMNTIMHVLASLVLAFLQEPGETGLTRPFAKQNSSVSLYPA
jgi:hypothetical protein